MLNKSGKTHLRFILFCIVSLMLMLEGANYKPWVTFISKQELLHTKIILHLASNYGCESDQRWKETQFPGFWLVNTIRSSAPIGYNWLWTNPYLWQCDSYYCTVEHLFFSQTLICSWYFCPCEEGKNNWKQTKIDEDGLWWLFVCSIFILHVACYALHEHLHKNLLNYIFRNIQLYKLFWVYVLCFIQYFKCRIQKY